MSTLNCWDYFKCERDPEGINSMELGVCPATKFTVHHGINGGFNAGRYCWTVEGTLCNDEIQGGLDEKLLSCLNCSFFKLVNSEEGREFTLIAEKTNKIK